MNEWTTPSAPASGKTWPRPQIVPLPAYVAGVENAVRLLDGDWKLNPRPPQAFWSPALRHDSWMEVDVPRSVETYGLEIPGDQEYAYRREVTIPAEFAGQRIVLRFDGVSCLARVWVDGTFVRSHYGGYTSWDCEISDYARPGQTITLAVGVTHKPQEVSPMQVGGMIRDVRLLALPPVYLTRVQVETDFDAQYRDATLKLSAGAALGEGQTALVRFSLTNPQGQTVFSALELPLTSGQAEGSLELPVAQPLKWDAEHPNLYQLQAELLVDGQVVERVQRAVGFRKIVRDGNRLLVNGQPVKLRGVNRHDIYPTTGRGLTPEIVELDVRLFKAANVNFIRTSHYPPREDFLDACDRLGMYVEDEIAVAFVYQFIHPTESDPQFTAAYLGQFSEMIERDRSHPAVLMWSLCNESYWGSNFQQECDYARREDSTRPLLFSYPITIPEGVDGCDLWSLHYAEWDHDPSDKTDNHSIGNGWGRDKPVLHDEYAHVACYDHTEKMRDPAVRELWGESLKRFWESILVHEGALGGAIWGGIDEIMITPTGYRGWEWGVIDGWRRLKPEHWLTKKAYSPIRISDQPQPNPGPGQPLAVAVHNWFDHTDLAEVEVRWKVGDEQSAQAGPRLAPHSAGQLVFGPRAWQDGETLHLQFVGADGGLIDEYNLPIGEPRPQAPAAPAPAPVLIEEPGAVRVVGRDFELRFSQASGLIEAGDYREVRVIEGGPTLNLVGLPLPEWRLEHFAATLDDGAALVCLSGSYGEIQAHFTLRITGDGSIITDYGIDRLPFQPPRARKLGVGTDVGGYREVGVAFTLASSVDRLSWERRGQWSAYPANHISRNQGLAHKLGRQQGESYGRRPTWDWAEDMRDFPLFGMYDVGGRGTKDFFSSKHNVLHASAAVRASQACLRAESDGSDAVRLEVLPHPDAQIDERDPRVHFRGNWIALDEDVHNFRGSEMISDQAGDDVTFAFEGSGVAWMAAKDTFYGLAEVYLDGVKQPDEIDLYYSMPISTSRGEEKIHQQVVYSVENLPAGPHTLRIVATGRQNPKSSNSYVSVDAFIILGGDHEGAVRMNVNNLWNYPELTWGNYVKEPILIGSGYTNRVCVRLCAADPEA